MEEESEKEEEKEKKEGKNKEKKQNLTPRNKCIALTAECVWALLER